MDQFFDAKAVDAVPERGETRILALKAEDVPTDQQGHARDTSLKEACEFGQRRRGLAQLATFDEKLPGRQGDSASR